MRKMKYCNPHNMATFYFLKVPKQYSGRALTLTLDVPLMATRPSLLSPLLRTIWKLPIESLIVSPMLLLAIPKSHFFIFALTHAYIISTSPSLSSYASAYPSHPYSLPVHAYNYISLVLPRRSSVSTHGHTTQ